MKLETPICYWIDRKDRIAFPVKTINSHDEHHRSILYDGENENMTDVKLYSEIARVSDLSWYRPIDIMVFNAAYYQSMQSGEFCLEYAQNGATYIGRGFPLLPPSLNPKGTFDIKNIKTGTQVYLCLRVSSAYFSPMKISIYLDGRVFQEKNFREVDGKWFMPRGRRRGWSSDRFHVRKGMKMEVELIETNFALNFGNYEEFVKLMENESVFEGEIDRAVASFLNPVFAKQTIIFSLDE